MQQTNSDTLWATVERIVLLVGKGLTLLTVGRAAGPAALGVYFSVLAAGSFGGLLLMPGLPLRLQALVAKASDAEPVRAGLRAGSLAASVATAALLGAHFLDRSDLFGELGIVTLIVFAWGTAFSIVLGTLLHGLGRFRAHAIGNMLQYGGFLSALLILASLGQALTGAAVVAIWVVALWAGNAFWAWSMRSFLFAEGGGTAGDHRVLSVDGAAHQLGLVASSRLDLLILATAQPAAVVGLYATAKTGTDLLVAISSTLGPVALRQGAKGGSVRMLERRTTAVSVMFAFAGAVSVPFVVPLVLGGPYEDAVAPAVVLIIASPVLVSSLMRNYVDVAVGSRRPRTWGLVLTAGLVVVLGVVRSHAELTVVAVSVAAVWVLSWVVQTASGRQEA